MILLPKYKLIESCSNVDGNISLKGEYRIKRYNSMGQLNYDTGWVRNLITDYGLRRRAKQLPPTTGQGGSWGSYFYIGSGTTPPAVTDTTMSSFLAYSGTSQGSYLKNSPATAPNYERWGQECKRFIAGLGTGTVNEVGLGSYTTGLGVVARQLVTPGISKAVDEVLDVYWRITEYQNQADRAGTIVINGITYDTLIRPIYVTGNNYNSHFDVTNNGALEQVSDQPLVAKTAISLSNTILNIPSTSWSSSYGDYYQQFGHTMQLNEGNLANGIRSIIYSWRLGCKFQVQFTAQTPTGAANPLCIPKDATKELTSYFRVSFARHP